MFSARNLSLALLPPRSAPMNSPSPAAATGWMKNDEGSVDSQLLGRSTSSCKGEIGVGSRSYCDDEAMGWREEDELAMMCCATEMSWKCRAVTGVLKAYWQERLDSDSSSARTKLEL